MSGTNFHKCLCLVISCFPPFLHCGCQLLSFSVCLMVSRTTHVISKFTFGGKVFGWSTTVLQSIIWHKCLWYPMIVKYVFKTCLYCYCRKHSYMGHLTGADKKDSLCSACCCEKILPFSTICKMWTDSPGHQVRTAALFRTRKFWKNRQKWLIEQLAQLSQ